MSARTNTAKCEFSEGSLPDKRQLVEKVAIDPADLRTDQFKSERLGKRIRFALAPITFCIGVVATLAWLSYGDAARRTIANSFPRLGWSVPQAAPVTQDNPDVIAPTASAGPIPVPPPPYARALGLYAVRT